MKGYKKILLKIAAIMAISIFAAIPTIAPSGSWSIPYANNLWNKESYHDVTDVAYFNEAGSHYVAFIELPEDTVYVMYGNGTEYWKNTSVSGYSIAAGDVDGDGKNEVIVGGYNADEGNNGITVFESDGTFKFFYPTYSAVVKGIELGDINGDGINDIVAFTSLVSHNVYAFKGTDGSDIAGNWPLNFDETLADIALGNLDSSGGKDVAILSNSVPGTLYVYNSTGVELWRNDSVRGRSVEIGNVDNDTENEVVIGDQNSSYVYVYNGSTGELKYSFNTESPPSEVKLGDLDGDGKDEIAAITEGEGTLYAIDINATGQANKMWSYDISWTPNYYGKGLAIGDVDRDYKNEVIAASDTHDVYAFDGIDNNNDGIGDVVWRYGNSNDDNFNANINDVEVGDVDGDGDKDVIVGTSYNENPTVWVLSTQENSVKVNGRDIFVDSDPSYITSFSNPPMPPNPPAGYNFPYGVFSINITVIHHGDNATITFTLPENLSTSAVFWKYSPNGNGSTTGLPGWYQIPLGDNDGDNVITINLQDGGIGDADGVANGEIVDFGGPALPSISSAKVPAISLIGTISLIGLLSIIALLSILKKRT